MWLKNIVTLPGTLLCPGTQADNTFKLKKSSSRQTSVLLEPRS